MTGRGDRPDRSERGAPLRIWRLTDGRRGHENQTLGLTDALAALTAVETTTIATRRGPLGATLLARGAECAGLPSPPAFIVGAGHSTHLAMFALRRRWGGRTVVLMRPSLPLALFDVCIAPAHDGLEESPQVLITRGAINRIRPLAPRDPQLGMVLLGGPSRHHRWDDEQIAMCVARIASTPLSWEIATSRRTPVASVARIRSLGAAVEVFEPNHVDPDWLASRLGRATEVWVTADSVSMVYEALSAGAAVGLIELAPVGARGARIAAALAAEDAVTPYSEWERGAELAPPPEPLAEAERAAHWLLERYPAG